MYAQRDIQINTIVHHIRTILYRFEPILLYVLRSVLLLYPHVQQYSDRICICRNECYCDQCTDKCSTIFSSKLLPYFLDFVFYICFARSLASFVRKNCSRLSNFRLRQTILTQIIKENEEQKQKLQLSYGKIELSKHLIQTFIFVTLCAMN